MSFRGFLGQSAIEYLMTYGWMMIAVSIVSGVVFSAVGSQETSSVSGFIGSDVQIENFGMTADENLALSFSNARTNNIEIQSVEIKDDERDIRLRYEEPTALDVGDSARVEIAGTEVSESLKTHKITLNYSMEDLEGLTVSGDLKSNLRIPQAVEIGEVGEAMDLNNDAWYSQSFSQDFNGKPLVFVTTQTTAGTQDPSAAHIRNLDTDGFETQHCEYDSSDSCDSHNREDNGWIALSRPELNSIIGFDSGLVQIGSNKSYKANFRSISSTPLVFTQAQTSQGYAPRNTQAYNVSKDSAMIEFCNQNSTDGCTDTVGEEVAWMALDPSKIEERDGFEYGTLNTTDASWEDISFDQSFNDPIVVVDVQTENGTDEALYPEADQVTSDGAKVRFCEADGGNYCDGHEQETIAWLAIEKGIPKAGIR